VSLPTRCRPTLRLAPVPVAAPVPDLTRAQDLPSVGPEHQDVAHPDPRHPGSGLRVVVTDVHDGVIRVCLRGQLDRQSVASLTAALSGLCIPGSYPLPIPACHIVLLELSGLRVSDLPGRTALAGMYPAFVRCGWQVQSAPAGSGPDLSASLIATHRGRLSPELTRAGLRRQAMSARPHPAQTGSRQVRWR